MDKIPYHKPMPLGKLGIQDKITKVLNTGMLTNGKYVRKLEEKIKEMYNVEECIALSSCTQGILACLYYEMSEDCNLHTISLPSFTWKSLLPIIDYTGIDIEWIDINRNTWLPLQQCTIGLHTFGNISDYGEIYDGSHAFGATLKDIGKATVFSLAPTKLITSCEGGLVITNIRELGEFVREYRDKCARMSEVHAIVGLKTLEHLEEVIKWKVEVYNYYRKHIPGQFQKVPYDSNFNTIGFINTEGLVIPESIETRQYYEPLKKGLKNTDYVYKNMICLPSWYGVDYKEIVRDILEDNC